MLQYAVFLSGFIAQNLRFKFLALSWFAAIQVALWPPVSVCTRTKSLWKYLAGSQPSVREQGALNWYERQDLGSFYEHLKREDNHPPSLSISLNKGVSLGHFRVSLCICVKTKTLLWKWVWPTGLFSCKSNIFKREVLHEDSFWNRGTWKLGNRQLSKRLVTQSRLHSTSNTL